MRYNPAVGAVAWMNFNGRVNSKIVSGLGGKRVALLEARMSNELAGMIERLGGVPLQTPAVRESPLDAHEAVEIFLNGLARNAFQVVIFMTGVGAKALLAEADRLGRLPELLAALQTVTTMCRGPKPVAVLKRNNIPVSVMAREPHTTHELLEALKTLDLVGKNVALIHYGERNVILTETLSARGAQLTELCLYEWLLPEDIEPLRALVRNLVSGQIDAIAFTSQVQARHLFQVAEELDLSAQMLAALNRNVVVASIGPTCTAVLLDLGVTPRVVPEHPKMGHLVLALNEYLEQ